MYVRRGLGVGVGVGGEAIQSGLPDYPSDFTQTTLLLLNKFSFEIVFEETVFLLIKCLVFIKIIN